MNKNTSFGILPVLYYIFYALYFPFNRYFNRLVFINFYPRNKYERNRAVIIHIKKSFVLLGREKCVHVKQLTKQVCQRHIAYRLPFVPECVYMRLNFNGFV